MILKWSLVPMRPKVRGLTQHGGPPGWLRQSDPAECDFLRDGRSTPLAPVWGWSIAKCTQNNKTPSWATSRMEGMAWYSSRPMPCLFSGQYMGWTCPLYAPAYRSSKAKTLCHPEDFAIFFICHANTTADFCANWIGASCGRAYAFPIVLRLSF